MIDVRGHLNTDQHVRAYTDVCRTIHDCFCGTRQWDGAGNFVAINLECYGFVFTSLVVAKLKCKQNQNRKHENT